MSTMRLANGDLALGSLNEALVLLQWSEQVLTACAAVTQREALRALTAQMSRRRQGHSEMIHQVSYQIGGWHGGLGGQSQAFYRRIDLPLLHCSAATPSEIDLIDWCMRAEAALRKGIGYALDQRLSAQAVRDLQMVQAQLLTDHYELQTLFDTVGHTQTLGDDTVAKSRVLVVEDDADLRSLVSEGLEMFGFSVDQARDGVEALSKVSPEQQDVILLDLTMPRLSGLDFLTEMQKRVENPPPVVIFSAGIDAQTRRELHVAGFVSKTAGIEEVAKTLRRLQRVSHISA